MQPNAASEPIYYNSIYFHGVDEKRRIQIPAKWRGKNSEVLTLILWPRGSMTEACLLALPDPEWVALVQKVKAMSYTEQNAGALRHLLGRRSDRVRPDKAGRICLPEAMAGAAAIDKEVVLVGLLDRFEIWDPERYKATSAVDEQLLPEAFKLI